MLDVDVMGVSLREQVSIRLFALLSGHACWQRLTQDVSVCGVAGGIHMWGPQCE